MLQVLISFLWVLLLVPLCGCVPSPYFSYYQPSYPDASAVLSRGGCHGQAGPLTEVSFNLAGGLPVKARIAKAGIQESSASMILDMTLNVPVATWVQFLSDDVEVTESNDRPGKRIKGTIAVVAGWASPRTAETVDMDSIGPVAAHVAEAPGFNKDRQLALTAELRFKNQALPNIPDRLTMTLPGLFMGGVESHVAPVHLHRDNKQTGWRDEFESDKQAASRQERFKTCIREDKSRNCESILHNIIHGFSAGASGYTINGSLLVSPPDAIGGIVRYQVHDAVPWRFASDSISFTDEESGRQWTHRFGRFDLLFNWYDIPLSTRVRGVGFGYFKYTTVRIKVDLGEHPPTKFFISLPPMLVNGKEVQFQPIEFNFVPFSGGIDPFNC